MGAVCIGKLAPNFTGKAVVAGEVLEISLRDYLGKNVVLFFYPKDFTYVCPTELHAFQEKARDFAERDAVVIGCSVDDLETHARWLATPKSAGGIEGIEYPLLADTSHAISEAYGVFSHEQEVAFRGTFLIDRQGIVRHIVINDLPLGRSIGEELRVLDALSFFEAHGMVCPANWSQGQRAMLPNEEGLKAYFEMID